MPEEHISVIECSGTPREMGRQYGEQARDEIRANVQRRGTMDGFQRDHSMRTKALLERHAADVLDELEGVGEGSGVPLLDLIAENCVGTPVSQECTTIAISAGKDGPVLGKNNDGALNERHWVLRRTRPARGLPMIQVISAGWLSGLDAINAAGLANGHNSVGSVLKRRPDGLEIRLWSYQLMQRCENVAEFVGALASIPLDGKGFNVVAADSAGGVCVAECALPYVACRGLGDQFVYATNHYVSEELKNADRRTPDQKTVSVLRYGFLLWNELTNPPRSEHDIRCLLTSHEPWAPCRHGGAHMDHTLWSMIARPRERRIRVSFGAPCESEYHSYQL